MQNKKTRLLNYLKGYRLIAVISPIFKFVEAAFELIVPMLLAKVIDVGIANGDIPYILRYCVYMGLLAIGGICFSVMCQRLATVSSVGYGKQMRSALYAHINTLGYAEIDKLNTPRLMNNLNIDTINSQNALGLFIRLVLRSPFLALGSIVLAFFISARLSFIFLSAVVIIGILVFLIMRTSIPRLMKINAQTDKITRLVKENIYGSRVIRAYSREERSEEEFVRQNEVLKKAHLRVNKILMLGNPMCFLLINFAVVLVVYLGGFNGTDNISAGDLIALVNYLTQNLLALLVLVQVTVIFSRSMASNRRIREVFAFESEDLNENGAKEFDKSQDAVVFENVTFGYAEGKNVIKNVSFCLPSGERAGITGSTGSGQSTLLMLISAYYKARSGRILLYGREINDYNREFLRREIKIAESVPLLFEGTVRDNVRAGGVADDEEIRQAIKAACADGFANDLDGQISAGGSNLSKGQRQRLGIARAIAANPTILMLDDALSSLDNVTANKVITRIFEKSKENGTAVLVVTRNPRILKECDMNLCLDS